ncbi:MAG: hypothetical protein ACYDA1_08030 [Vulcanimicrobiaceae bacterium]
MSDASALRAALEQMSQFRLTDAKLAAEVKKLQGLLQAGQSLSESDIQHFVRSSRQYLERFASEANNALRDVDRRLVNAHQVVTNFTAERGVIAKRLSDISHTLSAVNDIDSR